MKRVHIYEGNIDNDQDLRMFPFDLQSEYRSQNIVPCSDRSLHHVDPLYLARYNILRPNGRMFYQSPLIVLAGWNSRSHPLLHDEPLDLKRRQLLWQST